MRLYRHHFICGRLVWLYLSDRLSTTQYIHNLLATEYDLTHVYCNVFPVYMISSFVSLMKVMKAVKKKVQLIRVKNVYRIVRKSAFLYCKEMQKVK